MKPGSGAFQHIQMGVHHLAEEFDLVPYLPEIKASAASIQKKAGRTRPQKWQFLRHTARDIRDFCRNWNCARKLLQRIKDEGVDAIYYRMAALDPFPLLAFSGGYKVFIEANGLQFEGRRAYSRSVLSWLYRPFEKWVYTRASHTFFVGSYGHYWKLNSSNWTNVENGIEAELFTSDLPTKPAVPPLRIAFVGQLMKHHRFDVLLQALNELSRENLSQVELHLIGGNFNHHGISFPADLKVIHHGSLSRQDLFKALCTMHVGLIPGAPEYQSQMKLFDYALSACLVLAPDTFHLKREFGENCVLFFDSGSANSLGQRIEALIVSFDSFQEQALKFRSHVENHYSWRDTFKRKSVLIQQSFF